MANKNKHLNFDSQLKDLDDRLQQEDVRFNEQLKDLKIHHNTIKKQIRQEKSQLIKNNNKLVKQTEPNPNYKESMCYQIFGKRVKDLSKEELKIYRGLVHRGVKLCVTESIESQNSQL